MGYWSFNVSTFPCISFCVSISSRIFCALVAWFLYKRPRSSFKSRTCNSKSVNFLIVCGLLKSLVGKSCWKTFHVQCRGRTGRKHEDYPISWATANSFFVDSRSLSSPSFSSTWACISFCNFAICINWSTSTLRIVKMTRRVWTRREECTWLKDTLKGISFEGVAMNEQVCYLVKRSSLNGCHSYFWKVCVVDWRALRKWLRLA